MNPTSKKFISLFLIISFMSISCTTMSTQRQKSYESSKERRGAKLIVTKLDGQLIKGELIAVKPNSLLLLDAEGKDVSIDIADIKFIRIVKKSRVLKGISIGGAIGGMIGAVIGATAEVEDEIPLIMFIFLPLLIFAPSGVEIIGKIAEGILIGTGTGAVIGGSVGAMLGTDKTIRIEGKSPEWIEFYLEQLRKKARIRDYK